MLMIQLILKFLVALVVKAAKVALVAKAAKVAPVVKAVKVALVAKAVLVAAVANRLGGSSNLLLLPHLPLLSFPDYVKFLTSSFNSTTAITPVKMCRAGVAKSAANGYRQREEHYSLHP